jgi:hypothetical protein
MSKAVHGACFGICDGKQAIAGDSRHTSKSSSTHLQEYQTLLSCAKKQFHFNHLTACNQYLSATKPIEKAGGRYNKLRWSKAV